MATLTHSLRLHNAAGLLLAVVWGAFAYRHVNAFVDSGHVTYLVFCFSESLQAGLFIFRLQPMTVSSRPLDWTVAIAGTVSPLCLVPAPAGVAADGGVLVMIGAMLQILGLLSLNRSFAIVPAKRRIRTNGMYRVMRHPIYAAYLVLFSGYVWGNTTAWNVTLYCFIVACILARVVSEERHLSMDAAYREYAERVRYRLVPFVY